MIGESGSFAFRRGAVRARHDARAAMLFLLAILGAAVLAPWMAPYDPNQLLDTTTLRSAGPSWTHLMGTDPLSRDILSRMMFGARTSFTIAGESVLIATTLGTMIGAWSGFVGGAVERFVMAVVDVLLSLPRVVILLLVAGMWGSWSTSGLALILGLTGWMSVSRLVRAEVRSLRATDHVLAVRALGVGKWRVLFRHVIPSLLPLLAVTATSGMAQVLLVESGLSILGVGVPSATPSWGGVLLDVSDVIGPARWLVVGPGVILMCCVAAIFRLGDSVDQRRRTFTARRRTA